MQHGELLSHPLMEARYYRTEIEFSPAAARTKIQNVGAAEASSSRQISSSYPIGMSIRNPVAMLSEGGLILDARDQEAQRCVMSRNRKTHSLSGNHDQERGKKMRSSLILILITREKEIIKK
jgi:hypothetical protein